MIFLPAFFLRRLYRYKGDVHFSPSMLGQISLLILCAFPIILFINGFFLQFLSHFFELKNVSLGVVRSGAPLWTQLFFLALVPAIAEETLFRGFVQKTLTNFSEGFIVFVSALVFAIFHFELQNFVAPLLFGILLATIYRRTGSLPAVIYGHFLHNTISILFLSWYNDGMIEAWGENGFVQLFGSVENFIMVLLLVVGVFAFLILRKIFVEMEGKYRASSQEKQARRRVKGKDLIPFLFLVMYYIMVCVQGG
ncbi:CPBP family intramembrane metalloprotease [Peptoniphilus sp. KCTC 25270]|uniref:CPBP family intramembrane glutamic endopeptidase n=1 Tax=Peptoniphilus sp. KCTC 25270 TaxID=2897414 RepID=UPI001E4E25EF|nr:CPBP family intramembrane glutamic endopeptidase [Peptoniphilus sp. KCTC 25270]MCD1147997.1 CPBP family intramembrane metalloprotease [Peptoniphilus sp. KCTC 25270]